jgi:hypothetical protein
MTGGIVASPVGGGGKNVEALTVFVLPIIDCIAETITWDETAYPLP